MYASSKEIFREFFKTHRFHFFRFYVVGAVGALANVLLPISIGGLLAISDSSNSAKTKLFQLLPFHPQTIGGFFLFFAVLLAIRILSIYSTELQTRSLSEQFVGLLRERLFSSVVYMKPDYFNKEGKANVSQRFFNDMTYVKSWLGKFVMGAPIDAFVLLVTMSVLFGMSWLVLLGTLAILGLFSALSFLLAKTTKQLTKTRNQHRSAMMQKVVALSENYLSVKVLNREKLVTDDFSPTNVEFTASNTPIHQKRALLESLQPLQVFLIIAWIMVYFSLLSDSSDTSSMMTCVLLVLYSQGPIRRLTRIPSVRAQAHLSFDSINKQLLRKPESINRQKEIEKTYGIISFDGAFIQPNTTVSLAFHHKEKVAEFTHAWTKLKPSKHKISIDQIALSDIEPFELRKRATFVLSSVSLVGPSLFSMLSYTTTDDRKDSVLKILHRLDIPATAEDLAFNFSKIQELYPQDLFWKLNVARAIISKKSIVILHIPWSELALPSVVKITELLNSYRGKRTFILLGADLPSALLVDKKIDL